MDWKQLRCYPMATPLMFKHPIITRRALLISLNSSFANSAEISARFLSGWYCLESRASRKQLHRVRTNDRHNKSWRYFWMMLDLSSVRHFHEKYPEIRNNCIEILRFNDWSSTFSQKKCQKDLPWQAVTGRISKLLAKPTFGMRLTMQSYAANEDVDKSGELTIWHIWNTLEIPLIPTCFERKKTAIENQRIWNPYLILDFI